MHVPFRAGDDRRILVSVGDLRLARRFFIATGRIGGDEDERTGGEAGEKEREGFFHERESDVGRGIIRREQKTWPPPRG